MRLGCGPASGRSALRADRATGAKQAAENREPDTKHREQGRAAEPSRASPELDTPVAISKPNDQQDRDFRAMPYRLMNKDHGAQTNHQPM